MVQIHSDAAGSPISRDGIDTLGDPVSDFDKQSEPRPSPLCVINQALQNARLIKMGRLSALILIAFQFAYLKADQSIWGILPTPLMIAHVCTILVGFATLSLTVFGRSWVSRH
jgi:hypothetical protein